MNLGLFMRYKSYGRPKVTVPPVCPARTTPKQLGGLVCRWLLARSHYGTPYVLDETRGQITIMGKHPILTVEAVPGEQWIVTQDPALAQFAPRLCVRLEGHDSVIVPVDPVYDPDLLAAGSAAYPGFIPVVRADVWDYGFQARAFMTQEERTCNPEYADVIVYERAAAVMDAFNAVETCVLNAFEDDEYYAPPVLTELEKRAIATITC